ncbi:MAG TPA: FAD-dependent oxidoreductase [Jatrophihabitantaceae bacterium]|nr:FAD-dependent oxidoreductase [Jatrophihabitantaceae bacterium]
MTSEPADSGIVIVGGGLAGAKAAEAAREKGYGGPVTLVGAESHLPYERPPLSKGYLMGKSEFAEAQVHDREWYAAHNVDLRLETRVESLNLGARTVRLNDGSDLPYGRLLLATGSTPRTLPLPGADADGVLTLRTVENSDAIRATFGPDRRLVIVGAGWIGLEVAAAAREAGTQVTIIEAAAAPLLAVLGETIAAVFTALHRAHGVDLRVGAQLAEITTEGGRATGVRLADGETIAADAVVVGIGAAPDVRLAAEAGLDVDNGVLVDASLRTSDPNVWAVGDIANQAHPLLGRRVRVEHWANALNQPAAAVAAMLGHQFAEYDALPYFYSDQYDLGMEYIGLADPKDRVLVRGDLDSREFVAFWLDDEERIRAAMNVNVWDVVDVLKPIIREQIRVDLDRLVDLEVGLNTLG